MLLDSIARVIGFGHLVFLLERVTLHFFSKKKMRFVSGKLVINWQKTLSKDCAELKSSEQGVFAMHK